MKNKYELKNLSKMFHENTKKIESIGEYDKRIEYKIYPNSEKIKLINCKKEILKSEFIQNLIYRKSIREWEEKGIKLIDLSNLLNFSFGYRGNNSYGFRTYASAGGRYPIEVYVLIENSPDLKKGIYHYNLFENCLELIKESDFSEEIYKLYKNQPFELKASFYLFFTMVFNRTMDKYGERGYRFIYLDAGHMLQNLNLVATYLGLGGVELGASSKSDDYIDKMLGLSSELENVFLGVAMGYPKI